MLVSVYNYFFFPFICHSFPNYWYFGALTENSQPGLYSFSLSSQTWSLSEFHIHLANSSWISPLLQCTLIIFPQTWASLVSPLSAKGVPVRLGGQVIFDVVFSASTPYPPVTKLYWPVPWMCLEFIHSPHFNPSRCHSCPFY